MQCKCFRERKIYKKREQFMKYYLAPDSALHSPPYPAPYSKI